ncbi:MAG TPA: hypothetical protein PKG52_09875 [bacterium]|nr:hypothetical protein [bacterium]HPS31029.1 hypothetical protein [bacterium]
MNKFLILLVLCVTFFSCSKSNLDLKNYIVESEPNEQTFQANEIEAGNMYAGEIAVKSEDEADTDLFKIWRPAGTEITIEVESDEADFFPYIGHTDNIGHSEFVTFVPPGRYKSVFMTSVDGWQYFEVGDVRNTDENGPEYGGFNYYFRVSSVSICDNSTMYETLSEGGKLDREFDKSQSGNDIVEVNISENGYYQFRIDSETLESDKYTFIFNCDSGESAAGNDDEDYNSNLMNPLIYSRFESNLRYLAVTGRLFTDLNDEGADRYTASLKKQLIDSELEPNNLYNYANVTGSEEVTGNLSEKALTVLGETVDDQDWFKFDFVKGSVVDFAIRSEDGKDFSAEFWAGTYPVTGTTVIPLRFSSLSGSETHHINMMMPFTGTAYLLLSGKDENYEFTVSQPEEIETLLQFNGLVHKKIDMPDCRWAFYKWNMPESGELFEVRLVGVSSESGIHVFSEDMLPYAFVEPAGVNRVFIRRYEKTETLYLGLYFGNCEQLSGETMDLRIVEENSAVTEWTNGVSTEPVKVEPGSYSGYFNTDDLFVENNFEVTIPYDGTLYLSTSPDRNTTSFDIDTVITVFKDSVQIAENDDMIDFLNYNKYSRLAIEVKKGENYTVRVKPFMTESSNIPSMNIKGNYILDIIIK